ncbi:MAG: class I SAM-dependent methyltransferase [Planctomycetota bacterium]
MATISAPESNQLDFQIERKCRFCDHDLTHSFVDLGLSPPCENVRLPADMDKQEVFFPLHVFLCDSCWLVQLREYIAPDDIFVEYAYFSSMSESWLAHARKYADDMVARFGLDSSNQVIEIASNDGYLLQNFVRMKIPALGVEPAINVARVGEEKGVRSINKFFGVQTAKEIVADGIRADLLLGNNVLAHVPDLNDFVGGMKVVLSPQGVITMEFPHLLRLMENRQFDTIYHEHYSYLSLLTVQKVFEHHGLRVFDVQELASHGGSIRVFATHEECSQHPRLDAVDNLLRTELAAGLNTLGAYQAFRGEVEALKFDILSFLIKAKREGKTVAGYGAPGKGITLLNYCGIRSDLMPFTVDRNEYKQGTFMPGTGIPVFSPDYLRDVKPDYVFILPWNLKKEIMQQMEDIRSWGSKFVVPIPALEVL